MVGQTICFVSATQCDTIPLPAPAPCPAKQFRPRQRHELALEGLAGTQPVSDLARRHQVSRKFLYQQADTAEQALDRAFDPPRAAD
ncbi:MAG TPA: hypothetical protein VKP69_24325, partial [Isosphaeraceae bacterium]|nr:hypothetical protein [Isosphaeraceae bacterium]